MSGVSNAAKADTTFDDYGPAVQDTSGFWDDFDKVSDSYVKDLVNATNVQLDNLLLFATLFSGINTAFLVFSLPNLNPNPLVETNVLLRLIVISLNNTSAPPLSEVASASNSSGSGQNIAINQLFSSSLTCSIVVSFLAVLGKQWLTCFDTTVAEQPLDRRREMQRKVLGARKWLFESILGVVLPAVIQLALLLFLLGFVMFLQTFNTPVAVVNAALALIGLIVFLFTTIFATIDPGCPFQTPWSQTIVPSMIRTCAKGFRGGLWLLTPVTFILQKVLVALQDLTALPTYLRSIRQRFTPKEDKVIKGLRSATYTNANWPTPPVDKGSALDVATICWVFESVRDANVLRKAAKSITEVQDRHVLHLAIRRGLGPRVHGLWQSSSERDIKDRGIYRKAFFHLYLSNVRADGWWHSAGSVVLAYHVPGHKDSDENLIACVVKKVLHDQHESFLSAPHMEFGGANPYLVDRTVLRACDLATPTAVALGFKLVELSCHSIPGRSLHEMQHRFRTLSADLWDTYSRGEDFILKNAAGALHALTDCLQHDTDEDDRFLPPYFSQFPQSFSQLLACGRRVFSTRLSEATPDILEDSSMLIDACIALLRTARTGSGTSLDDSITEEVEQFLLDAIKAVAATPESVWWLWDTAQRFFTNFEKHYAPGDSLGPIILQALTELLNASTSRLRDSEDTFVETYGPRVLKTSGRVLMKVEAAGVDAPEAEAFSLKVMGLLDTLASRALPVKWDPALDDEGPEMTSESALFAMSVWIKRRLSQTADGAPPLQSLGIVRSCLEIVKEQVRFVPTDRELTKRDFVDVAERLIEASPVTPDVEVDPDKGSEVQLPTLELRPVSRTSSNDTEDGR